MMYEVVGTDPKNLRVFRDFRLLMGLRGSCGARAKGLAEAKADGLGVRGQELGVERKFILHPLIASH